MLAVVFFVKRRGAKGGREGVGGCAGGVVYRRMKSAARTTAMGGAGLSGGG